MKNRTAHLLVACLVVPWSLGFFGPAPGVARAAAAARAAGDAAAIVARIMRADYEGDRAALRRLADEIGTLTGPPRRLARIRYWRGHALVRAGQNGVNDGADPQELLREFRGALDEYDAALASDPSFDDAKAGRLLCFQALAFLNRADADALGRVLPQLLRAIADLQAVRSDNPRVAWVLGAQEWYAPPGTAPARIQEKQAAAMTIYERALRTARAQRKDSDDSLDPVWGEPELLMSLAWSNANRTPPDPAAAERYAREALALVPYWHYVRDILMPQIQKLKD
jgi:tetratricopeptide (TPR) repeat protein